MTRPVGRLRKDAGQERWWRVALAVGALGASLLGSELIASREAALNTNQTQTVITVPVRDADGTIRKQRLELAPVPTAIPRRDVATVARSRSSR